MKFKLDFKIDTPTPSGHIYTHALMSSELCRVIYDCRFLPLVSDDIESIVRRGIDMRSVIGLVQGYTITKEKDVFFNIDIIQKKFIKLLRSLSKTNELCVTTAGHGNLNLSNVVECFYLHALVIVSNFKI